MSKHFNLNFDADTKTLNIGFNKDAPATNAVMVKEVDDTLSTSPLPSGTLVKINGAASLPVAYALAHHTLHRFGCVAVFDPKIIDGGGYIVVASHGSPHAVGDILPA